MRHLFGAAGAWGQRAPAAPVRRGRAALGAIGRFRAVAQLHR